MRNLILGEKNELHNRDMLVGAYLPATSRQSVTEDSLKSKFCTLDCTLEETAILYCIENNPKITQKEMASIIRKSERTVKSITSILAEKGIIIRRNGRRNGWWEIVKLKNHIFAVMDMNLDIQIEEALKDYLVYNKVPRAVNDFCGWLNEEISKVDKKNIAACYRLSFEAHFRLVTIHPWVDGNGRTTRLVMNMIQRQSGLVPSIVSFVKNSPNPTDFRYNATCPLAGLSLILQTKATSPVCA